MNKCEICGMPSGKHSKCRECYYKNQLSLQTKYIDFYRKMLTTAWAEGKMTTDEDELINTLKNLLGISEELHKKIEHEVKFSNKELIEAVIITEKVNNDLENDFRKKYPLEFRTEDGHFVRSKAERSIDNWFFSKEIAHIYERLELNIDGKHLYCDFYLPYDSKGKFIGNQKGGIFVEFWGLEENQDYAKRMAQKKEVYQKKGLILVEIFEKELYDPSTLLPKKFMEFFGDRVI